MNISKTGTANHSAQVVQNGYLDDRLHLQSLKFVGRSVAVFIDQPRNSLHPRHSNLLYKIDYGFVPNTVSSDGEEIDAYVLDHSGNELQRQGVCIGVILRPDGDDKLLVVINEAVAYVAPERIWDISRHFKKNSSGLWYMWIQTVAIYSKKMGQ